MDTRNQNVVQPYTRAVLTVTRTVVQWHRLSDIQSPTYVLTVSRTVAHPYNRTAVQSSPVARTVV